MTTPYTERSGERLSKLQQRVLLLASISRLQAVIQERRTLESPGIDVSFAEILKEVYDLEPVAAGGERIPAIDQRRYSSGMAAVSRAARRLELRGLVAYQRGSYNRSGGVSISPAGRKLILAMVEKRRTVKQER